MLPSPRPPPLGTQMDVRCSRCATEYEFDDALISERGTTVKCTNCGFQFKIFPPKASQVAPVDKLGVVFAIVFAAIFLKEKITPQHMLGGLLVVAGALVLAWSKAKA